MRATEHCGSTVQTGSRRDLVVISSWPVSSLDVWLSSPAHHLYPCESEVPRARARAPRGSRPRVAAPRPRAVWDVKHVSFAQAPAACPHPACPPRFVPNSVDGSYVTRQNSERRAVHAERGPRGNAVYLQVRPGTPRCVHPTPVLGGTRAVPADRTGGRHFSHLFARDFVRRAEPRAMHHNTPVTHTAPRADSAWCHQGCHMAWCACGGCAEISLKSHMTDDINSTH